LTEKIHVVKDTMWRNYPEGSNKSKWQLATLFVRRRGWRLLLCCGKQRRVAGISVTDHPKEREDFFFKSLEVFFSDFKTLKYEDSIFLRNVGTRRHIPGEMNPGVQKFVDHKHKRAYDGQMV